MKFFMLLGGFAGFLIVFGSGLFAGNDIDLVLLHAMIGCLVGAGLMRGYRHLYVQSLRAVVVERARRSAEKNAPQDEVPDPLV